MMRKFLLLGTMLSVAGTALAFGGMFSHGSKSSTYKGGVDAIGVHFGGEKKTTDSQPKEDKCSDGMPCGEGCCYGDNVCQQNELGEYQCCSEELDWCCEVNETAHEAYGGVPGCCAGKAYCPSVLADGSCSLSYQACCEGETYRIYRAYVTAYGCCFGKTYEEVGRYDADLCCVEGQEFLCAQYDNNNKCIIGNCCAGDAQSTCIEYDDNNKCIRSKCCNMLENEQSCCDAGFAFVSYKEGDYFETACCTGQVYRGWEDDDGNYSQGCCPEGSTGYSSYDGECCEPGTQPTEDPDGEMHCCPNGWNEEAWECA